MGSDKSEQERGTSERPGRLHESVCFWGVTPLHAVEQQGILDTCGSRKLVDDSELVESGFCGV
jgi:hypothetical protein